MKDFNLLKYARMRDEVYQTADVSTNTEMSIDCISRGRWAGAEARVFTAPNSSITDRRTDGPTDRWTNGPTDQKF